MSPLAYHLQNPFYIRTIIGSEQGELRVNYTLTGIVVCHVPIQPLPGSGNHWSLETGHFAVPLPKLQPNHALHLEGWAPFVTLSSISNDRTATDAGWAVDEFGLDSPTTPIKKEVNVFFKTAVRDIDGFINRLAYHINLIGLEKSFG